MSSSTRPPRAGGGTKARTLSSREAPKIPGVKARRDKISSAGSLKGDLGEQKEKVLKTALSSISRRNSSPLAVGAKPPAKSKLTKVDGEGTKKLIQKEWRSKKGGDLLSKLDR